MSASERKDVWVSGVPYEGYMGRWSRLVAREFLAWLAVPPQACWLDIGCSQFRLMCYHRAETHT